MGDSNNGTSGNEVNSKETLESTSAPWSATPRNTPPGSSKQQSQHEKLKEYEARRRLAYSSKFDSMSLHWKSYRDLLSASLQETSRAQRLVLGTCRAHQIYSDAMTAMYEDVYLDEKGNIATEKQQKRLAGTRKTMFRKRKTKEGDSKQTPILSEIRESQKEMADKIGENARNMDNEIAAEVGSLLNDLKFQFDQMERLGSSILSELEKTEQEVVQSWGLYLRCQSSFGPGSAGMGSTSPQETAPKNGENPDAWLAETQYRVTVAYQNSAWEKGSTELSKLFSKIKQEEILRRMHLREFLVAFVQRQERLFMSMPGVQSVVLDELMKKELTQSEIDEDIRASIASRTAKFKNTSTPVGQYVDPIDENLIIDSPMSSELLVKAMVISRKGTGPGSFGQKISLVVITADSFMHMFDLNPDKVKIGSAPEEAFESLSPRVVTPTAENFMMGVSNFSKGWSDTLMLSDSIILGNCIMVQKDDTSFELTETVENKGASKMFGKSAKKKVLVTAATKEEADELLAVLTPP